MANFSNLQGLNPAQQISLNDARALRTRLEKDGFQITSISCIPMGWGSQTEQTETDLETLGVPTDLPINLFFRFANTGDANDAALVAHMFDGTVSGFQRVFCSVYSQNPMGWVNQLLNIPSVQQAINAAL